MSERVDTKVALITGANKGIGLATLGDDGPSGVLYGYLWQREGDGGYGVIPW